MQIKNLEIHITHACNLACQQCSHFSNFNHKGILTAREVDFQMCLWSSRLKPDIFSLLGGEPALNPELPKIVKLAREHWPNSKLQLISNGFFLKNHPSLPSILEETNCSLEISIHHDSDEYLEKIKEITSLMDEWKSKNKIKVNFRFSNKYWRRVYLGDGPNMKPYEDNNQRQSWVSCCCKYCPQIFEDRIWKCPPITYLKMTLNKFKLSKDEDWIKYLDYQPLHPMCSDGQLNEFFTREDENICNMCPAFPERFELPNPIKK